MSLNACATSSNTAGRPVNVAAVRNAIDDAMPNDRTITAMGRTRAEFAIVYTQDKSGARHEEKWVRAADGWKLETSSPIAAN